MDTSKWGIVGTADALQLLFGAPFEEDTWTQRGGMWVCKLVLGKELSYDSFPVGLEMVIMCDNLSSGRMAMLLTESRFVSTLNEMQKYFETQQKGVNVGVVLTSRVEFSPDILQGIASAQPLLHQLLERNRFQKFDISSPSDSQTLHRLLQGISIQAPLESRGNSSSLFTVLNFVILVVICILCWIVASAIQLNNTHNQLQSEYTQLENLYNVLQSNNTNLQSDHDNLKQQQNELLVTNSLLRDTKSKLESTITQLKYNITQMETNIILYNVTQTENKIKELTGQNAQMIEKVTVLTTNNTLLAGNNTQLEHINALLELYTQISTSLAVIFCVGCLTLVWNLHGKSGKVKELLKNVTRLEEEKGESVKEVKELQESSMLKGEAGELLKNVTRLEEEKGESVKEVKELYEEVGRLEKEKENKKNKEDKED